MASPTLGSWTPFTISLNSLANGSARQSTAVDLSSGGQPHDVMIGGSIKTAAGSLSTSTPYVNVYAYAKTDGTNYSGGASGSDGSYTVPTEWQPKLIATFRIDTANSTLYMHPRGVASLFGGQAPSEIGIIVQNSCGLALDSSAGGSFSYRKVTY